MTRRPKFCWADSPEVVVNKLAIVYKKYKHLEPLILSDNYGIDDPAKLMLQECWKAIKSAQQANQAELLTGLCPECGMRHEIPCAVGKPQSAYRRGGALGALFPKEIQKCK